MDFVNGYKFDQDTEEQVMECGVEECPTCGRSSNEVMEGDSIFVACSECIDGFNNTVTIIETESDSMSSRSFIEQEGVVAMAIAELRNRKYDLNTLVGDNDDNDDDKHYDDNDEDDEDDEYYIDDDGDENDHEDGQIMLGDDEENIGEEENSDNEMEYIDVDGNTTDDDDDSDDNNHNNLYYGKYEDIILVFGPDSSRG